MHVCVGRVSKESVICILSGSTSQQETEKESVGVCLCVKLNTCV